MNPLRLLNRVFFPPACHQCGSLMNPAEPHEGFPFLCHACHLGLPAKEASRSCQQCGNLTAEPDRKRCPVCAARTFHTERVYCLYHYTGQLREWLLRCKYSRADHLVPMLGHLMWRHPLSVDALKGADLVLPVPLHRGRLRQRGFNQSYLLADAWLRREAEGGGAIPPLDATVLARIRNTQPQAELNWDERERNVADAFSLSPEPARGGWSLAGLKGLSGGWNGKGAGTENPREKIRGKTILLVDDLLTTGATLNACARSLLDGGARRVEAIVLARA